MADDWSEKGARPGASGAPAPEPDPPSAPDRPSGVPSEQDLVARNLRMLFESYQTEPVPDRLRDLLSRLAEEEGRDKE